MAYERLKNNAPAGPGPARAPPDRAALPAEGPFFCFFLEKLYADVKVQKYDVTNTTEIHHIKDVKKRRKTDRIASI